MDMKKHSPKLTQHLRRQDLDLGGNGGQFAPATYPENPSGLGSGSDEDLRAELTSLAQFEGRPLTAAEIAAVTGQDASKWADFLPANPASMADRILSPEVEEIVRERVANQKALDAFEGSGTTASELLERIHQEGESVPLGPYSESDYQALADFEGEDVSADSLLNEDVLSAVQDRVLAQPEMLRFEADRSTTSLAEHLLNRTLGQKG